MSQQRDRNKMSNDKRSDVSAVTTTLTSDDQDGIKTTNHQDYASIF